MRQSSRPKSRADDPSLILVRSLIEKSQDRGIPSDRSDAWGPDQLREMNVGIEGPVGFLNEDGMIDDSQQRCVVDTVFDADTLDTVGLIPQPLLSPIATQ